MKPEYDEDYKEAIKKMDGEEEQDVGILGRGSSGLNWDIVLDRVRDHLATLPDRGGVVDAVGMPAWITTAINQTQAIIITLERAEWDDHLETLLRPQLDDLLETLRTAGKEVGNGSDPKLPAP